jgi:hypothetical protein
MRWTWDLEPHGGVKLMGPMLTLMGRRQERTIWTSLKRVLEAPETSIAPAWARPAEVTTGLNSQINRLGDRLRTAPEDTPLVSRDGTTWGRTDEFCRGVASDNM